MEPIVGAGKEAEAEASGQKGKRRMNPYIHKELTLEDYAAFYSNPDFNLTCDQINDVFSIHGFCKVDGSKDEMLEAMRSISLLEPSTSSLVTGASPELITEEEALADMEEISWNECATIPIAKRNQPLKEAAPTESVADSN